MIPIDTVMGSGQKFYINCTGGCRSICSPEANDSSVAKILQSLNVIFKPVTPHAKVPHRTTCKGSSQVRNLKPWPHAI